MADIPLPRPDPRTRDFIVGSLNGYASRLGKPIEKLTVDELAGFQRKFGVTGGRPKAPSPGRPNAPSPGKFEFTADEERRMREALGPARDRLSSAMQKASDNEAAMSALPEGNVEDRRDEPEIAGPPQPINPFEGAEPAGPFMNQLEEAAGARALPLPGDILPPRFVRRGEKS